MILDDTIGIIANTTSIWYTHINMNFISHFLSVFTRTGVVAMVIFLSILLVQPANAQALKSDILQDPNSSGESIEGTIKAESDLGTRDPRQTVELAIQILLGIISLLAVSFIIYGGISWLISAGDPSKVSGAQAIIRAAIMGLIITIVAWGITLFIVRNVYQATYAGAIEWYIASTL